MLQGWILSGKGCGCLCCPTLSWGQTPRAQSLGALPGNICSGSADKRSSQNHQGLGKGTGREEHRAAWGLVRVLTKREVSSAASGSFGGQRSGEREGEISRAVSPAQLSLSFAKRGCYLWQTPAPRHTHKAEEIYF